jgi:hypothetical protein
VRDPCGNGGCGGVNLGGGGGGRRGETWWSAEAGLG